MNTLLILTVLISFRIEKELINRPTLPEGTKIITIPALELSNISGAEGDTALNQKVVKKTKKKWIINPVGKSTVKEIDGRNFMLI